MEHSVGKYFKTIRCPACPQSAPPRFSVHRWLMLILIFSTMITSWQFPAPVLSPLVPVSRCYFAEPLLLFSLPVTYHLSIHPPIYLNRLSIFWGSIPCSLWDLVPWPKVKPMPPALETWSPNHWTSREVLHLSYQYGHVDSCCFLFFQLFVFPIAHAHAQSLTHVWLFLTPWTVACQTSLSLEFPRQEYCSGLPFPPQRALPDPGIESTALSWQADSLPLNHWGYITFVNYFGIKIVSNLARGSPFNLPPTSSS